jgi:hypothetical protein
VPQHHPQTGLNAAPLPREHLHLSSWDRFPVWQRSALKCSSFDAKTGRSDPDESAGQQSCWGKSTASTSYDPPEPLKSDSAVACVTDGRPVS